MKSILLNKDNLDTAQQYIGYYGRDPYDNNKDRAYVKLLRIYDNGFFTSGGFAETIEICLDKKDEVNTLYVSAAAMDIPVEWHKWDVFCFNLTDDQEDSGSLSGIDLIKAAEYNNMDNPPTATADGVFLINGKKYNACVFLRIIERK